MNHTSSKVAPGEYRPFRIAIAAALLACLAALTGPAAKAQIVLETWVPDTLVDASDGSGMISVYARNHYDSVAGFAVQLYVTEPGTITFNTDVELEGTAIYNWEFADASLVNGDPRRIRIIGLADLPTPTEITPPMPPQPGDRPLVRIGINVHNPPDSGVQTSTMIEIEHHNLQVYAFSDPQGQLIGTVQDSVKDTVYWNCLEWNADSTECLEWEWLEEPQGPDDSFLVVWRPISYLDTSAVAISDGVVVVGGAYLCGDVNGDWTGPNISDLVYLVSYMFGGGPEPAASATADCLGDWTVDVADLVCFVSFMFQSGTPPACGN
jgi:hypothetical protein